MSTKVAGRRKSWTERDGEVVGDWVPLYASGGRLIVQVVKAVTATSSGAAIARAAPVNKRFRRRAHPVTTPSATARAVAANEIQSATHPADHRDCSACVGPYGGNSPDIDA